MDIKKVREALSKLDYMSEKHIDFTATDTTYEEQEKYVTTIENFIDKSIATDELLKSIDVEKLEEDFETLMLLTVDEDFSRISGQKVLEENSVDIVINFISKPLTSESYYFYEFIYQSKRVQVAYISRKENLEQACRSYIRENKFDVKWFDEDIKEWIKFIKSRHGSEDLLYYLLEVVLTDNEINSEISRLIAYLYSEDIEVK